MSLIDPARLHDFLTYAPDTGALVWKSRTPDMFTKKKLPQEWAANLWNAQNAGRRADLAITRGYRRVTILAKAYQAHRIIWAMQHGKWPDSDLDHINHARDDNRIENLRPATQSQNNYNRPPRANTVSGLKGVSWDTRKQKWEVKIRADKVSRRLGYFDDPNDAHAAYAKASAELHGEYGRLK